MEGLVSRGWKNGISLPLHNCVKQLHCTPREEPHLEVCGGRARTGKGLERGLLEGTLVLRAASPGPWLKEGDRKKSVDTGV